MSGIVPPRRSQQVSAFLRAALFLCGALESRAASVVTFQQGIGGYTGTVDTFVSYASPSEDHSAASTVMVGGSPPQQVLLRFNDIIGSGPGQIPPGATILSATLTVNATIAGGGAAFHRMLQAWTAHSTWDSLLGGVKANGSEALASADLTSGSNFPGSHVVTVTSSVAAWSAGEANRGWALLASGPEVWGLASSESEVVASRPLLSVTYTDNRSPELPAGESPVSGAGGISRNPNLCVDVRDPDDDALSVTFKGRPEGQPAPQDFTVVVLPDTQFYAQIFPTTFRAQTQWCVDQRAERNIAFVTQLGDCTNMPLAWQWANAADAFAILEDPLATGLASGIPYGIAVGNHDQSPAGEPRSAGDEGVAFGGAGGTFGGTTALYNERFGTFRFEGRGYFGGHYDFDVPIQYSDNMDNHYELFSTSGMDFIVFHLEWDPTANATRHAVLNWMRNLLATTHADRRAIISAHYLLNTDGTFSSQGQAVFNAIRDLPNVFLMLCGHLDQASRRMDLADDSRPVYTLLSDYQTLPEGGNGWLRILTFSPATDTIHVQTYSPTLAQFINDHPDNLAGTAQNDFVLSYDMDDGNPYATIGVATDVASGGRACVTWQGRARGHQYEWFVETTDGELTMRGPTWTFERPRPLLRRRPGR